MVRRHILLAAAAGILLAACHSAPPLPAEWETPEQRDRYLESRERMLKKFDIPRLHLIVDAMAGQEFLGVEFFQENSESPFIRWGPQQYWGTQQLEKRIILPVMQPVPERVRIVRRDSSKFDYIPTQFDYIPRRGMCYTGNRPGCFTGNIIGEELIEVGSRIPQELIDDLKRDPQGVIRLKFRMSDQGTLFGWDIQRRPAYDPKKHRQNGEPDNVAPEHSFAGGDFREAEIINGKPVRKGWYIDRRTGQKIETDF